MSLLAIDWHPDARALRRFGWSMLIGFGVIGLALYAWPWSWPFSAHPLAGLVCLAAGLVAGGLGLTGTRAALPVYYLWMGLAFAVGSVVGRVLLAVIYYGLITPMGLGMRLIGRDRLHLRRTGDETTYWRDVRPVRDKDQYERQF